MFILTSEFFTAAVIVESALRALRPLMYVRVCVIIFGAFDFFTRRCAVVLLSP